MTFSVNMNNWNGIFAVPNSLVDKHIKFCTEKQLKVLLIILKSSTCNIDIDFISNKLSISNDDVTDCIEYWVESGILIIDSSCDVIINDHISDDIKHPIDKIENGKNNQKIITVSSSPRLTVSEINKMSLKDKNISFIIQETQQYLGKLLSPSQSASLISFYSNYSLTPDFIMMACEYCKSKNKSSFSALTSTLDNWLQKDIDTHEKVDKYLQLLAKNEEYYSTVSRVCGISGRNLSEKEKRFSEKWIDEYKFDEVMISEAYNKTIDSTGKLSFAYMDKILQSWLRKGIKTPESIENELYKYSNASKKNKKELSFGLDEIEEILD